MEKERREGAGVTLAAPVTRRALLEEWTGLWASITRAGKSGDFLWGLDRRWEAYERNA